VFYFYNVPGASVYCDAYLKTPINLNEPLASCNGDTGILVVTDAGAARGFRRTERIEATADFVYRLKLHSPLQAWLNPMPRERWVGSSAQSSRTWCPCSPWIRPVSTMRWTFCAGRVAETGIGMSQAFDSPANLKYARQLVDQFARRFGEPHRLLAYYAALPLVLTPDLLNYLRNTFLRGRTPWVAEADLLLSDLCHQIGYEQYVMQPDVRVYLQSEMTQKLGVEQVQAAARLIMQYVGYLKNTNPFLTATDFQTQRWAAMVYIDENRDEAVGEIAQSLSDSVARLSSDKRLSPEDQAEIERLSSVVAAFVPESNEAYAPLINYAIRLARWSRHPLQLRGPSVVSHW